MQVNNRYIMLRINNERWLKLKFLWAIFYSQTGTKVSKRSGSIKFSAPASEANCFLHLLQPWFPAAAGWYFAQAVSCMMIEEFEVNKFIPRGSSWDKPFVVDSCRFRHPELTSVWQTSSTGYSMVTLQEFRKSLRPPQWPGGKVGHQFAPPDVPVCGYLNELCKSEGGS